MASLKEILKEKARKRKLQPKTQPVAEAPKQEANPVRSQYGTARSSNTASQSNAATAGHWTKHETVVTRDKATTAKADPKMLDATRTKTDSVRGAAPTQGVVRGESARSQRHSSQGTPAAPPAVKPPPTVTPPTQAPTVTPPKRPAFKIIMGDTKSAKPFVQEKTFKIDSSTGPRGGTQGSTIGGRTQARKSKRPKIEPRGR